jgi:hypothetical protein
VQPLRLKSEEKSFFLLRKKVDKKVTLTLARMKENTVGPSGDVVVQRDCMYSMEVEETGYPTTARRPNIGRRRVNESWKSGVYTRNVIRMWYVRIVANALVIM